MTVVENILEDGAATFSDKNDDYGDSWRMVGRFMYELTNGEGVELTTEEDFIAFGLFTRRLDKIARAFNGRFLADDMNFEDVVDSHEDEMVYAAMHASLHAHKVAEQKVSSPGMDHHTTIPTNAE